MNQSRTSHNNGNDRAHDEVGTHHTHWANTNTGLGGTVPVLVKFQNNLLKLEWSENIE